MDDEDLSEDDLLFLTLKVYLLRNLRNICLYRSIICLEGNTKILSKTSEETNGYFDFIFISGFSDAYDYEFSVSGSRYKDFWGFLQ